jgi:hypothetical protein
MTLSLWSLAKERRVLVPVHELRRIDAQRSSQLADGGRARLGLIAFDPNYGVYADTSLLGQLALGHGAAHAP